MLLCIILLSCGLAWWCWVLWCDSRRPSAINRTECQPSPSTSQSTASRLPAARRTSLFISTRGQAASSSCQKPNGCRSPIVARQTSRMWTSASPSPDKRAVSSSILAKEWACHTWCWNHHNELDMSDKQAAATLKQTDSVCRSEIDDDCKKCHYKISLSKQKTWGKMWQKNVTFWT